MARMKRALGENHERNQKTMILLFVMLLVSTSIYGKDDNLPEIDTIRITFTQVYGYGTYRSTASYAYQHDTYELQTIESPFPNDVKYLPNTVDRESVKSLLEYCLLKSTNDQCDYINVTKDDYSNYLKVLNNPDSLIYYFPQLSFGFKKEPYDLKAEDFLTLSCSEIINMIKLPHNLFFSYSSPIKIELLSTKGKAIVVEPQWHFEGTAWRVKASGKELYVGYEYIMSFLRNVHYNQYVCFEEKIHLLFQIAESIVDNREQLQEATENVYWEDIPRSKQDSILRHTDSDLLSLYQGKIVVSDNNESFELLDKLCHKVSGAKQALYFLLFSKIMEESDGALSEVMGEYCMRFVDKNADFVLPYLANHEELCKLYASFIATELYYNEKSPSDYKKKSLPLIKTDTKIAFETFFKRIEKESVKIVE